MIYFFTNVSNWCAKIGILSRKAQKLSALWTVFSHAFIFNTVLQAFRCLL